MNRYLNLMTLLLQVSGGGGGGGGGSTELGNDHVDDLSSDLDILNGDDEKPEGEGDDEGEGEEEGDDKEKGKKKAPKPPKEGDEDDESSDEDEEEGEGDDEEEESEEDEEETPEEKAEREAKEGERVEGRPTPKQLKAVFKQFPGMREIYFKEGEYSKLFADPEQAQEASTKAQYFDRIEASVAAGDPKVFLTELTENPKVYAPYIKNFLPALRSVDERAYLDITEPIIAELLYHATEYGKKHNNMNMVKSAKWIADYVYANGGEIPDIGKKTEKHPAELELERLRAETARGTQDAAQKDVNGQIETSLVGFLSAGMDSRLSPIEKKYIVDQSLNELITVLSKDSLFGQKMRGLWKRAATSGFSQQSKATITGAHVARAKLALKDIRDRLTEEALKGRRRPKPEDDETPKPKKRSFNSQGRGGGSGRRESVLDSSKIDYSRTSDQDILADQGGDRIKVKGKR